MHSLATEPYFHSKSSAVTSLGARIKGPTRPAGRIGSGGHAKSEGINRVIKLVARNAFGFRNADSQRLRTRCVTTRRARHGRHHR